MRPERDPNADGRSAPHPDGVTQRVVVVGPHVETCTLERGAVGFAE